MISKKFSIISAGAFALSMAFTAPAMAGSDSLDVWNTSLKGFENVNN